MCEDAKNKIPSELFAGPIMTNFFPNDCSGVLTEGIDVLVIYSANGMSTRASFNICRIFQCADMGVFFFLLLN